MDELFTYHLVQVCVKFEVPHLTDKSTEYIFDVLNIAY